MTGTPTGPDAAWYRCGGRSPTSAPTSFWWNTGAPERFGADLYITDFLDHRGEAWDAFTDHELHDQGAELLQRYRVILTGTHPEYCSREMLIALRQYLENGGRVMYLGGNGFYWVTSIDPQRPHQRRCAVESTAPARGHRCPAN